MKNKTQIMDSFCFFLIFNEKHIAAVFENLFINLVKANVAIKIKPCV